jgi:hypothetical protein
VLLAHDQPPTEPPLWSIGIAVAIILTAPLVLSSLPPSNPIREGDTVFSQGEQHVLIHHAATARPGQADETCLLDPNSPLIVIQSPADPMDNSFIAHVQGNPSGDWPFCPVHTEVLLKTYQVFQKPPLLGTVRDLLTRLSGR